MGSARSSRSLLIIPVLDQRGIVVFVVALLEAKSGNGVASQGKSAMATGTSSQIVISDGAGCIDCAPYDAGLLLLRGTSSPAASRAASEA